MQLFAGFIVGVLLGWIVTWFLQKRLNDNLTDEVAKLQRELTDCQRQLDKAGVATTAPEAEAAGDTEVTATRAAAAVAVESAVAPETTVESPAGETVVEEAVVEETVVDEVVVEEAVAEQDVVEETVGEEDVIEEDVIEEDVVATRVDEGLAAAVAAAAEPSTVADRDEGVADLTVIKGIGPKFAETLNAAGITSYAALANETPERLQEVVQPAAWQKVDFDDWIAQASALSRQSRRLQIGDDLTRLEGIGPAYAQKLRAAGITAFAQLAESDEDTLADVIDAPAWRRAAYGDWIAQAQLAAAGDEAGLQALQDKLFSREGDNIGLIQGIGDTTEAALTEAGITTYAQLAESTPEQLAEILSAAGVRRGNVEAWIEEAKQRSAGKRVSRAGERTRAVPAGATTAACPQDLGEIEGVGETYEQRLYNAGIGTFWEVSMLPQEELRDLLEIKAFQGVDLDGIQASARSLAESTNSVGRVWDGAEPDDFEILAGIGEVYERRLYDAGICTFAAMAQLSVERLQEICQAPPNFAPNFERWLEQAREAA